MVTGPLLVAAGAVCFQLPRSQTGEGEMESDTGGMLRT